LCCEQSSSYNPANSDAWVRFKCRSGLRAKRKTHLLAGRRLLADSQFSPFYLLETKSGILGLGGKGSWGRETAGVSLQVAEAGAGDGENSELFRFIFEIFRENFPKTFKPCKLFSE